MMMKIATVASTARTVLACMDSRQLLLSPLTVPQSAEMEMLTKEKSAMVENSVPAANATIDINPLLPSLLIANLSVETESSMKVKLVMVAKIA